MPTPPFAQVQTSLNGGAPATGGVLATLGETVQWSMVSTVGVGPALWEIYDYPPGWTAPSPWALEADGYTYFYLGIVPPSFTASVWGKYMPRLTINNNPLATYPNGLLNPNYVAQLTDASAGVRILSTNGLDDTSFLESTQFSTVPASYVAAEKNNWRQIDAALGGSSAAVIARIGVGGSGNSYVTLATLKTIVFANNSSNATSVTTSATPPDGAELEIDDSATGGGSFGTHACTLTAGAGTTIEEPSSPGNYTGSAISLAVPASTWRWRYMLSETRWKWMG